MKKLLDKFWLIFTDFLHNNIGSLRRFNFAIGAFLLSFLLSLGGIYITASRILAIKHIKVNLVQTIKWMNEVGLDMAYDDIKFNSMFFSPLVKIKNLQIYNIAGQSNWSAVEGNDTWSIKFAEVKGFANILGAPRIRFESDDGGNFIFNDFVSTMNSEQTFLDVITKDGKFDELVIHAENLNIKNFAKIQKIAFLIQAIKNDNVNTAVAMPSFESYFEVNNVDINGLLKYPLSSHLKMFYAKTSFIGRFSPEEQFLTAMETWLKEGGFIEVPNLVIQWEPLTLVARGNVNFNEKFAPRIQLNTSSKGLLRLLSDLQKNNFLDSKNVFVANILLTNKAFKLNSEDTELTISTPISYSDGKISIENLTIKDFMK